MKMEKKNEVSVIEEKPIVVQKTENEQLMDLITNLASNPNVDVAKFSALLDLKERISSKQAEADFNSAYIRLASRLPRIKKNGKVEYPLEKGNPKAGMQKAFTYGKWEDIDEAIRPILLGEGFTLSYSSCPRTTDGGGMIVKGYLTHTAGHVRTAEIALAIDSSGGKNNLQGMGSTFSYGKKYVAVMLLNLIFEDEDDDGQSYDTISMEEAVEIDNRLRAAKADKKAFLDYFKVVEVRMIPKKLHKDVIAAIVKKEKQAAEEGKST
jgi:hypothetical protein